MAINNTFFFGDEFTERFQMYLNGLSFVVQCYNGCKCRVPTAQDIRIFEGDESILYGYLQVDVFMNTEALPGLIIIRKKIANRLLQAKAVYEKGDDDWEMFYAIYSALQSLQRVLAMIDNEIYELKEQEQLEKSIGEHFTIDDKMMPVVEEIDPDSIRESFGFRKDIFKNGESESTVLAMLVRLNVISSSKESWLQDLRTFRCVLFDSKDDDGTYKISVKGSDGLLVFLRTLCQYDPKKQGKITQTTVKWFKPVAKDSYREGTLRKRASRDDVSKATIEIINPLLLNELGVKGRTS